MESIGSNVLTTSSEAAKTPTGFEDLPPEMALHIISFIGEGDLAKAARVSTTMHEYAAEGLRPATEAMQAYKENNEQDEVIVARTEEEIKEAIDSVVGNASLQEGARIALYFPNEDVMYRYGIDTTQGTSHSRRVTIFCYNRPSTELLSTLSVVNREGSSLAPFNRKNDGIIISEAHDWTAEERGTLEIHEIHTHMMGRLREQGALLSSEIHRNEKMMIAAVVSVGMALSGLVGVAIQNYIS